MTLDDVKAKVIVAEQLAKGGKVSESLKKQAIKTWEMGNPKFHQALKQLGLLERAANALMYLHQQEMESIARVYPAASNSELMELTSTNWLMGEETAETASLPVTVDEDLTEEQEAF